MKNVAQIAFVFALAIGTSGCSDACQNTELSSAGSPDGRWRAVIFQRDCGATTGLSTQVSVLPKAGRLRGGGNAFVADDDHGAAAASSLGGPWASIRWLARDRLLISYDARARVFTANPRVGSIQVVFTKVSRVPTG